MSPETFQKANTLANSIKVLQIFIKPNGVIRLGRSNTSTTISVSQRLSDKILEQAEKELETLQKQFEEL